MLKRMRWKALFFLKRDNDDSDSDDDNNSKDGNYGLKTKRCPPQIAEFKAFEDDMLGMIENVKFRKI